jgi:hypothetical protein
VLFIARRGGPTTDITSSFGKKGQLRAFQARVAAEDASTGLFRDLLDTRHHRVDSPTQTSSVSDALRVFRALDAVNDLL